MNSDNLYDLWERSISDEDLLRELKDIKNNASEKYERFYKNLEFGTAGLRGIMGAGTNRMNVFTVRLASQGLADYLKEKYESPSVAISFDSRKNSRTFALETAKVMAGNKIKAYVTEELQPTPFLSFAVRNLKAEAGVMITASHNTAEYNGYKCYGDDGAQMSDAPAQEVYKRMARLDIFKDINIMSFNEAKEKNLISFISPDVYDRYLDCVMDQRINKFSLLNLSVVYTPLNGSGNKFVKTILKKSGVKDLYMVPEQEHPDENFTSCPYPNPELFSVFTAAVKLARNNDADIIMATDPDSDRIGVCVKTEQDYRLLNGNETGIILFDYIIKERIKNGTASKNPLLIKTIVSSLMVNEIAKKYGCEVKEVFTGFKNIASEILKLEKQGDISRYIFGFEESNGYLSGAYVRDKDAVSAALLVCEAAAYYKQKNGRTLHDVLVGLWKEYGFFGEKTLSFEFKGYEGNLTINAIMKNLRDKTPGVLGSLKVLSVEDYLNAAVIDVQEQKREMKNLPKADILLFNLERKGRVIVRPSGTEPKIKFYIMVNESNEKNLQKSLSSVEKWVNNKVCNFYKN